MYLDKMHIMQTGVILEISTINLRNLIANAMNKQQAPELTKIHSTTDLYTYLAVIVHEGSESLIRRRHRWANKIKADLLAGQPVSYNEFCNLFWRSLDEDDPDGDEWYRLTADDRFHMQMTSLLNKLHFAERLLRQQTEPTPDLSLEAA
jgi:hypothetical protein